MGLQAGMPEPRGGVLGLLRASNTTPSSYSKPGLAPSASSFSGHGHGAAMTSYAATQAANKKTAAPGRKKQNDDTDGDDHASVAKTQQSYYPHPSAMQHHQAILQQYQQQHYGLQAAAAAGAGHGPTAGHGPPITAIHGVLHTNQGYDGDDYGGGGHSPVLPNFLRSPAVFATKGINFLLVCR